MSDSLEALDSATSLDQLVVGYETCLTEVADSAANWWELHGDWCESVIADVGPVAGLLHVDEASRELMRGIHADVTKITQTLAEGVAVASDMPAENAKVLKESKEIPRIRDGYEYFHSQPVPSRTVMLAMEAAFDDFVYRSAIASDVEGGQTYIRAYSSPVGRAALMMAFDAKVYEQALTEADMGMSWYLMENYLSDSPSRTPLKLAFNRYVLRAAQAASDPEEATDMVNGYGFGDEYVRSLLMKDIDNNVINIGGVRALAIGSYKGNSVSETSDEQGVKCPVIDIATKAKFWNRA